MLPSSLPHFGLPGRWHLPEKPVCHLMLVPATPAALRPLCPRPGAPTSGEALTVCGLPHRGHRDEVCRPGYLPPTQPIHSAGLARTPAAFFPPLALRPCVLCHPSIALCPSVAPPVKQRGGRQRRGLTGAVSPQQAAELRQGALGVGAAGQPAAAAEPAGQL